MRHDTRSHALLHTLPPSPRTTSHTHTHLPHPHASPGPRLTACALPHRTIAVKAKIAKEAAKNIHAKTEEADLVHLGLEEGSVSERAKSASPKSGAGAALEGAKSSSASSLVGSATDLLGSAGDMAGDSIAELSSRRVEETLKEWARLRQVHRA